MQDGLYRWDSIHSIEDKITDIISITLTQYCCSTCIRPIQCIAVVERFHRHAGAPMASLLVGCWILEVGYHCLDNKIHHPIGEASKGNLPEETIEYTF
jgi:hypothetical protein